MRDIPVWLLVLVAMVGILALSLLVYLLLPRKPAVGELGAPAAPDGAAEKQARDESPPRHTVAPPAPGSENPAQAVARSAAVVEQGHGRHARPGGAAQPAATVQHQAAHGAMATYAAMPTPVEAHVEAATGAATGAAPSPPGRSPAQEPMPGWGASHVGPAAPTGLSEPMETPRNGAGPTPSAAPVPERPDATVSSAPHGTAARNGALAEQWEPPAVPAELAPPSPETLAMWAEPVGATETPPSVEAPAEPTQLRVPAYTGFTPTPTPPQTAAPPGPPSLAAHPVAVTPRATPSLAPDHEAQTPPSGLPTGLATDPPTDPPTDPALSALGWNQAPPRTLADAVAPPPVSEPTSIPPQQDDAYPNSVPPGPDGSSPSEEYAIKGNEGSRRFHPPDSPFYIRTRADVWFRTTEDAERAGFTPWHQRRR